jgi:hypothetical protein
MGVKYIYESPDKGKTVYRRFFGSDKRELVSDNEIEIRISEDGVLTIITEK